MRSRRVRAYGVGLCLAATVSPVPWADAVSIPPAVTGYVEAGTSATVIAREAHALTTVGVDGVTVLRSGAAVTRVGRDLRELADAAHAERLRAELLVSNYDGRTGDFSPRTGSRLLRNPDHRAAVVAQLAAMVEGQGWDGITVDLEALRADDGPGLTAFVGLLKSTLPMGGSVSVDLGASTTAAGYRDGGFQLAALAKSADVLAVMTYDRHGPTWSGPGPIGPLAWQRACLAALLHVVPADQVDLGVAGYGYTWPRRPHRHDGRSVTDAQARRMVHRDGATARWVASKGEWRATLRDGTVVWWSDGRSWPLRAAMADEEGLHGLALWRLGSADPLP